MHKKQVYFIIFTIWVITITLGLVIYSNALGVAHVVKMSLFILLPMAMGIMADINKNVLKISNNDAMGSGLIFFESVLLFMLLSKFADPTIEFLPMAVLIINTSLVLSILVVLLIASISASISAARAGKEIAAEVSGAAKATAPFVAIGVVLTLNTLISMMVDPITSLSACVGIVFGFLQEKHLFFWPSVGYLFFLSFCWGVVGVVFSNGFGVSRIKKAIEFDENAKAIMWYLFFLDIVTSFIFGFVVILIRHFFFS